MTNNQKRDFLKSMLVIRNLYSRESLDNATVEVYWQVLKSYDLTDIKLAINRYVRNPDCGQFFPKPADIIREIEGGFKEIAALAWQKVIDGLKEGGGRYSNVRIVYDDLLVHFVLDKIGGDARLRESSNFELVSLCSQFKKIYLDELKKKSLVKPKIFVGKADSRRSIEVKFVGDKKKARLNLNNLVIFPNEPVLIDGKLETISFLTSDKKLLIEGDSNETI